MFHRTTPRPFTSRATPITLKCNGPVKGLTKRLLVRTYGVRNRKNCAGVVLVIGIALEKFPLPSKFPTVFVVQDAIGVATFVEVSQV